MPIYEYKCDNCSSIIERLQKISAPPLIRCPECDRDSLRKLISAVAFKLKGTGWYETDFKDRKQKSTTNAGEPSSNANNSSGSNDKSAKKSNQVEQKSASGNQEPKKPSQEKSGDKSAVRQDKNSVASKDKI